MASTGTMHGGWDYVPSDTTQAISIDETAELLEDYLNRLPKQPRKLIASTDITLYI